MAHIIRFAADIVSLNKQRRCRRTQSDLCVHKTIEAAGVAEEFRMSGIAKRHQLTTLRRYRVPIRKESIGV